MGIKVDRYLGGGIRLMTIWSWVRFSQRGFFPDLLGFLLNWCISIILPSGDGYDRVVLLVAR
ncbi:hypothetical protein HanPSC8_Chr11g0464751 [Helianthus annuus]|nr:hypothetical protein HanPSC8_Chr11g0464751 [Helianthus annuus]